VLQVLVNVAIAAGRYQVFTGELEKVPREYPGKILVRVRE
jgi:hypothetical protein